VAPATVTACLLAGSSLPAAPTLVPRIVPRLVSILAGSLISGPIAQDCARRLVARDSKGESQLRRPLNFLQAAYDICRPSDLHRRSCTDLILTRRASPGSVSSAASRPSGNCNGKAIETILLGREGGGDDTTCTTFSSCPASGRSSSRDLPRCTPAETHRTPTQCSSLQYLLQNYKKLYRSKTRKRVVNDSARSLSRKRREHEIQRHSS